MTVQAFHKLCNVFTQMSILMHFNSELRAQIKTDALIVKLTNIYLQLQTDAQWYSVIFWLRKLNLAKTHYEIYNQELLTIVKAFKHWWHYLENSHYFIEILTDHNNLWEFMNVKSLNKRQAHWVIRLAAYDFMIIHWLEKTNLINVLLRHPDYKVKKNMNRLLLTLQWKLITLF